MTNFVKENFQESGEYLHYAGPFEGQKTYGEVYGDRCHQSRVNMPKEVFIARFKYRRVPKAWINFLVKNFTVEEYVGRYEAGESPLDIMQSKGYLDRTFKRILVERGYAPTPEGLAEYRAYKATLLKKNAA